MNKDKIYNVLMYIIVIILALLMGFMMGGTVFSDIDSAVLEIVVFVLSFLAAIIVQTILHEAGHLVFGLLTGYRFLSFRIFNIMWVKTEGKITVKRYTLPGTLGQCLLEPPEYSENYPYILYNLGGALMNVIVSLLSFVFYLLVTNTIIRSVMLSFLFYGLIFAVTNGIPLRTNYLNNDGMNMLEAKRDEDCRKALYQQLKINALLTGSVRLKDMDEELFAYDPEKAKRFALVSSIPVFCENRYMDKRDFGNAEAMIIELTGGSYMISGVHRFLLLNDKEYIDCLNNRYMPVNDKNYLTIKAKYMSLLPVIRTQIAIDKTSGDIKDMDVQLSRFNEVMKTYPYSAEAEAEEELVGLITG